MSESPKERGEPAQREVKVTKETSAKEKARAALEERSKKSSDAYYYWAVVIGFALMCVACVVYVIKEWRVSPNLVPAVSQVDIDSHNSQASAFKRAPNALFMNLTLDDAKHLFQSYLSDDYKNIFYCASREDKTALIPESYNFRETHKECAGPIMSQGNCSSAYALATASMISDRICMMTGKRNQISAQHVISCDTDMNEGCKKGYVQRAYDFYSKEKLVNESCMPYAGGKFVNCSDKCSETLPESGRFSRICGIEKQEQIKREILLYGPLVAPLEVHSDFLTYKEGIYNPDNAQYVYAGGHVVKIIGWGEEKGRKYWIIENTWGTDWGEDGFAKIEIQDGHDLQLSRLALGAVIEGKLGEKGVKREEPIAENTTAPAPETK